jgi:peptidoglycan/LPS O-acetylase OafA/YrhL
MDLRQLWRIAPKTNRGSMMAGNVAIRCPVCGAKLGVLQGRAQLSGLLGFGMLILLAMIASQLRTPGDSRLRTALIAAPFVIIAIAGYIIQQRSIPRLLQVRPLEEGEKKSFTR